MPTLGVVVLSLQGMKHLNECLQSVEWADSVTVVQVGEGEPPIGEPGCRFAVVRKMGSADEIQKLDREIQSDWILNLWGEERVGAELKEQLKMLCRRELQLSPSQYQMSIRSFILGRWVQGNLWGPSPAVRLKRKLEALAPGWWNGKNKSKEAVGLLQGSIDDYTLVDIGDGFEHLHGLSTMWGERLAEEGFSPHVIPVAVSSLGVFTRALWLNGVLSSGLAGFTLSTLAAYGLLLSSAKVWEAKNVTKSLN